MAKLPAIWNTPDGSSVITQTLGAMLLENGSYLLLEDGTSHLLLEGTVVFAKENTKWDNL